MQQLRYAELIGLLTEVFQKEKLQQRKLIKLIQKKFDAPPTEALRHNTPVDPTSHPQPPSTEETDTDSSNRKLCADAAPSGPSEIEQSISQKALTRGTVCLFEAQIKKP